MSYDKIAIILPNAVVLIDPEMTFKNYTEQVYAKILEGQPIKFVSVNSDTCVIYTHVPGSPLTMMTEKIFMKMQSEHAYARARQQGNGGIITP